LTGKDETLDEYETEPAESESEQVTSNPERENDLFNW
jgi:hypothetical protein